VVANVGIPASYSECPSFKSWSQTTLSDIRRALSVGYRKLKAVYTLKDRTFPAICNKSIPMWEKLFVQYTLQANAETIPQIRPRPLPTTSLPIHYSLIILPFDTVYAELATML
jgi:hypothetical protein